MNYFSIDYEDVLKEFSTSKTGLSEKNISVLHDKFGLNKLPEGKKITFIERFLSQFKDLLIIILMVAALISIVMGEFSDALIIVAIVTLNAAIGVIQEYKAENSLEALKKMMAPTCIVIRDGKKKQLMAEELVPGDIILLEEGTRIPADARIIDSVDFMIDESALTGESVPVSKNSDKIHSENVSLAEMKNMVFLGTYVSKGKATAIVVQTGDKTEFGKIASLTQKIEKSDSSLTQELNKVGGVVAKFALFICLLVFVLGVIGLINIPLDESELISIKPISDFISGFLPFVSEILIFKFWSMFKYAIAVAVAIVPEGLSATVTLALALGVRRMAKHKAIVKQLKSVEALGCTTVICSDKTGTLTQNQMTLRKFYLNGEFIDVSGIGYTPKGEFSCNGSKKISASISKNLDYVLKISSLCNDSKLLAPDSKNKNWRILGDPTEAALVVCSQKKGIFSEKLIKQFPRVFEFPFNSTRKLMTTVHKESNDYYAYSKGAPDILLEKSSYALIAGKVVKLSPLIKKQILESNETMAKQALRVLGFAYKKLSKTEINSKKQSSIENDLIFVGLGGMIDPPRKEVKDAIILCKKAGIRSFIITGDSGITAKAIALELNMVSENAVVISGLELDKLNDHKLKSYLSKEVIFARVSPEHKMRIVSILQLMGERVAVTGDGVNDAPALKKSDIGVAMGLSGTDVAKESSDVVLTDDGFATIVHAIEEGRGIYENIKKTILYAFSGISSELICILFAIFTGLPLPISAVQILWIDLGTEVFPGLALGVDPITSDVMSKKPRSKKDVLMNISMIFNILKNGFFIAAVTMFLFIKTYSNNDFNLVKASTIAFSMIIFMQMVNVFNCRSNRESIFKIGFFSNKFAWVAISLSIILTVLMIQVPFLQPLLKTVSLSFSEWALMFALSFSILIYSEVIKLIIRFLIKFKIISEQ